MPVVKPSEPLAFQSDGSCAHNSGRSFNLDWLFINADVKDYGKHYTDTSDRYSQNLGELNIHGGQE